MKKPFLAALLLVTVIGAILLIYDGDGKPNGSTLSRSRGVFRSTFSEAGPGSLSPSPAFADPQQHGLKSPPGATSEEALERLTARVSKVFLNETDRDRLEKLKQSNPTAGSIYEKLFQLSSDGLELDDDEYDVLTRYYQNDLAKDRDGTQKLITEGLSITRDDADALPMRTSLYQTAALTGAVDAATQASAWSDLESVSNENEISRDQELLLLMTFRTLQASEGSSSRATQARLARMIESISGTAPTLAETLRVDLSRRPASAR